jgi:nitrate reductase gamma subunit
LGIILAVLRRFVFKPKHSLSEGQDNRALLLIGLMVLAGFVTEGGRILMTQLGPDASCASFMGNLFAWLLDGMGVNPQALYPYLWWVHAGLAALFVAWLPFGKMRHIFAAPLSLMLNRDLK